MPNKKHPPPPVDEGGFLDGAFHLVDEAMAVGQTAGQAIHDAASTVYSAAGAAVTTVADGAQAAAVGAAHVAGTAATAATKPMLNTEPGKRATRPLVRAARTMANRYKNVVSPVVLGQGGDFAQSLAPDQEAVVLRIEIASSAEVKTMRWVAWIASAFCLAATIALSVIKTEVDATERLKQNNTYFLGSTILCAIFLAIMLAVAVIFTARRVDAKRNGLVWSTRRRRISDAAFLILMLQICNTACMLAVTSYSLTGSCNWQTDAALALGYVQWTMWNITFFALICLAHNGSLWRGKTAEKAESMDSPEDAAAAAVAAVDAKDDFSPKSGDKKAPGVPPPPAPPVALVLDAPFTVHLPKLLVWGFFQFMASLMLARYLTVGWAAQCTDEGDLDCGPLTTLGKLGIALIIIAIFIYMCAFIYYSWRTDKDIKARSYMEMKFARQVFGVQYEQTSPVFLTLTLSAIVLVAVNAASCWTFVTTWLGVVAVQAMGTAMACSLAFFFMPKRPQKADQIMTAWLQEFAWTVAEMPVALRKRNAKLADSRHLAKEPMFCMETCVKLINFSSLVYNIRDDEVDAVTRVDTPGEEEDGENGGDTTIVDEDGSRFADAMSGGDGGVLGGGDGDEEVGNANPESSMPALYSVRDSLSLYDLTRTEIIYDKSTDTKTLLAWGGTTLLVVFKGTSSFENVVTDLNFFKTFHPPRRTASLTSAWGLKLIKLPVRCHTGFLTAWISNGYDKVVVARVGEIMASMGGPEVATLIVTGHSLGGALATLGAHALKTAYPAAKLTVYTYGQPRVGNRAFAHEYNRMIDEHFCIINGNDPVTKIPKGAYKRVGQRVIVKEEGDIIVRPTYLEMHLLKRVTPAVSDHFCDLYRRSLMNGIKTQFTSRRLDSGQPGASELARWVDLKKALVGVNLSEEALLDLDLTPVTLEEVRRDEERSMRMSMKESRRSFSCGGDGGSMSCANGLCAPISGRSRRKMMEEDADDAVEEVTKVAISPAESPAPVEVLPPV